MIALSQINNAINVCELEIPASKSISNRCLIIQALCLEKITLENLSIADDTKILAEALAQSKSNTSETPIPINVGIAGTAFRFLCAFLSTQSGHFILTGAKRIQERPIKPLVDALIQLGADIQYLEKEGFAPLLIKGKQLQSKSIHIDAQISSQFISALLLIAPTLTNGIEIHLEGKVASKPYIDMTLALMQHFGIESTFDKQKISVKAQNYSSKTFFIEADWSSASYFYAFLALVEKGTITLSNYSAKSLQGDSVLFKLMQNFGVETHFYKNKIQLIKHNVAVNFAVFHYDFSENPDLVQTFVALCIGLNKNAQLTGLESLKIKETDRILALQNECAQFGWSFNTRDNETYFLKPEKQNIAKNKLIVKTYDDHRMAMSFAPLVMKYKALNIENENVVSKSNPLFWEQVKQLGINLCIV